MALTTFTRDGLTFDVDDAGDGEPVVLLHGFPQTKEAWSAVAPLLVDAGLRTLVPDQRGYSPGARPPRVRDYRGDHLVADVLALADAAGVDRFHVVGHDWGGFVAWALAAGHPDRVTSTTSLATPHPAAMQRAMLTSSQLLRSIYMPFFFLPRVPEALFRSGWGGRRVVRAFTRAGLPPADAEAALAMLRDGALTPALNWYRAIPLNGSPPGPSTVPTLYAWPSADVALGRAAAEGTARHVTGPYRFEVLEDADHFVLENRAERVASLVAEHVAAHPA